VNSFCVIDLILFSRILFVLFVIVSVSDDNCEFNIPWTNILADIAANSSYEISLLVHWNFALFRLSGKKYIYWNHNIGSVIALVGQASKQAVHDRRISIGIEYSNSWLK